MNRDDFLRCVTVIDTETTNLHAEKAEIVEVAGARYDGVNWHVKSTLLGAKAGIPPEASAKNHISNRMIEGLPCWNEQLDNVCDILNWPHSRFWVAHNCAYDQGVLTVAWDGSGPEHQHHSVLAQDRGAWICTYRLAKKLLDFDFNDMQYNLSFLRYKLDLPVPDELEAHRAGADTLVCAILFEFLVDFALATDRVKEGPDLDQQMHALCWDPIPISAWPFGKHKGQPLSAIPDDYYAWALDNLDALNEGKTSYDPDLAASVLDELNRRLG